MSTPIPAVAVVAALLVTAPASAQQGPETTANRNTPRATIEDPTLPKRQKQRVARHKAKVKATDAAAARPKAKSVPKR